MSWKRKIAGASLAVSLLAGSTMVAAPAQAGTLNCNTYVSKSSIAANCSTTRNAQVTISWTCKNIFGLRGKSGSKSFTVRVPGLSIGATTNCTRGYHSYSIGHRWL